MSYLVREGDTLLLIIFAALLGSIFCLLLPHMMSFRHSRSNVLMFVPLDFLTLPG